MNGNTKIILCVAGFIAIMAAVIGALFVLGNSNTQNLPDDDNQVNLYEPGSVYFDEDTTAVDLTLSPAMQGAVQTVIVPEHAKIVEAFVSGCYYITIVDYSSGEATEMTLALRGENVHIASEVSGMKLEMIIMNDNIYLVNSKEKKFLDFKSLMQMAGATEEDFDLSEMRQIAELLDVSEYNFHSIENFQTEENGITLDGYRFSSDEYELFFWFNGVELRRLEFGTIGQNDKMTVDIKEFSGTIPDGMLSLKGLRKSSMLDFFGEEFIQNLY